jgi:hypothetical protein
LWSLARDPGLMIPGDSTERGRRRRTERRRAQAARPTHLPPAHRSPSFINSHAVQGKASAVVGVGFQPATAGRPWRTPWAEKTHLGQGEAPSEPRCVSRRRTSSQGARAAPHPQQASGPRTSMSDPWDGFPNLSPLRPRSTTHMVWVDATPCGTASHVGEGEAPSEPPLRVDPHNSSPGATTRTTGARTSMSARCVLIRQKPSPRAAHTPHRHVPCRGTLP